MTDEELRQAFESTRQDLRQEMHAGFTRAEAKTGDLRHEMHAGFAEMRERDEEIKRRIDVLEERSDDGFKRVAEATSLLDLNLDRKVAELRDEMRSGFAETHDLIRFAFNIRRRKRK